MWIDSCRFSCWSFSLTKIALIWLLPQHSPLICLCWATLNLIICLDPTLSANYSSPIAFAKSISPIAVIQQAHSCSLKVYCLAERSPGCTYCGRATAVCTRLLGFFILSDFQNQANRLCPTAWEPSSRFHTISA
jgi:hypothetical protein